MSHKLKKCFGGRVWIDSGEATLYEQMAVSSWITGEDRQLDITFGDVI